MEVFRTNPNKNLGIKQIVSRTIKIELRKELSKIMS